MLRAGLEADLPRSRVQSAISAVAAAAPGLGILTLLLLTALLAAPETAQWGIGAAEVALVLGVALGLRGVQSAWRPGIASTRFLLSAALVLLGFRLPIREAAASGGETVLLAGTAVVVALGVALVLGRLAGLRRGLSALLGVGTGICGVSAVLAVRSATRASDEETAHAVSSIVVLGTVGLFALPVAAALLDLAPGAAGAWMGASLHALPQALGAGWAVGGEAGAQGASLVKLTRVAFMPVLALVLAAGARVPREVVLFVVAVLVGAFLDAPADVTLWLGQIERVLFILVMAGLGLQIDWAAMRASGPRPFWVAGGTWLAVLVATYAVVVWTW